MSRLIKGGRAGTSRGHLAVLIRHVHQPRRILAMSAA
jgi:hypothetical protein